MSSEPDPSSQEPEQPRILPPLLLASNVFAASSYATVMYSISRVTILNFQTPPNISPWALAATFAIPTTSMLLLKLLGDLVTDPSIDREKEPLLYLDYKWGARFMLPAAAIAAWTFARRYLAESLFNYWMPVTTRPKESIFGSHLVGAAWHATYISEFIYPLVVAVFIGKSVMIVSKISTACATCLLDLTIANLFNLAPTYAPLWIVLPSTAFIISTAVMDTSIRSQQRDDFVDRPYENALRRLNASSSFWSASFELLKLAFEVDFVT